MTKSSAPVAAGPVAAGPVKTEEAACMACGHSLQSHDRISARYCDATIAHATTRRCICKV